MSEDEARDFIDTKSDFLFKQFPNLMVLAVRYDKTAKSFYIYPKNINELFKPKKRSFKSLSSIVQKTNDSYGELLKVSPSTIKTANKVKPLLRVRNYIHLSDNTGKLGFVFKIKNHKYILSNWHVLATSFTEKGHKISCTELKKYIAEYENGGICDYYDFAYAKLLPGIKIEKPISKQSLGVITYPKIGEIIHFNSFSTEVISNYATVRVKDKIFANGFKIFKKQILTKDKNFDGDSGVISLDQNKENLVGLFFARNNKFNYFNNISIIINEIKKLEQINTQEIHLFNHFK